MRHNEEPRKEEEEDGGGQGYVLPTPTSREQPNAVIRQEYVLNWVMQLFVPQHLRSC